MCERDESVQKLKTVVIGSGSWGTALAQVLADNEMDVTVYGVDTDQIADLKTHYNHQFFDDLKLNPNIKATTEIQSVQEADVVLFAVPTAFMESACFSVLPYLQENTLIVNVAKGFHPKTQARMSQVIRSVIPAEKMRALVSLVGPSHAEEVALRSLTCIDAVSTSHKDAVIVQQMFSNPYLRVYTGTDEVGSEYGAAVKNVIAIASGILSGMGQGDNAKAALITRGLQEMLSLVSVQGGRPETCLGLTGVGDLIVTCSSEHSRNWQAGFQIGMDNGAARFMACNKQTTEGVASARTVHDIAERNGLCLPICEAVYEVLYKGGRPADFAGRLMERQLKMEF